MKLLGTLIALAIVGVCVYMLYGAFTFDPIAQGQENYKKVSTGMTWQQVVELLGEPKKVHVLKLDQFNMPAKGGGASFTPQRIEEGVKSPGWELGFVLPYTYSDRYEQEFWFDKEGKLTDKREMKISVEAPSPY